MIKEFYRKRSFKQQKNIKRVRKLDSNFIVTCPLCGYSFKKPKIMSEKKEFICPMCKFNFIDNNNRSPRFDDFTI